MFWKTRHISLLRHLVKKGVSVKDITRQLAADGLRGISKSAVQSQICRQSLQRRRQRRWTGDEYAALLAHLRSGLSIKRIAWNMDRTYRQIVYAMMRKGWMMYDKRSFGVSVKEYLIDGSMFTMREIIARVPDVNKNTLRHRAKLGVATWSEMSRKPIQGSGRGFSAIHHRGREVHAPTGTGEVRERPS